MPTDDPAPTHDLVSTDAPALVLTGERTLPGIWHENYWFRRHEVAYEAAERFLPGKVVLDAGCGEGYGLPLLRDAGAVRAIGVDLDEPTVAHARATYGRDPSVEVHRAELMSLPLPDDDVDVVVSFQVIEHLHDIPGYLASLRRVCRPGGHVLIATPNRLTFTPDSDTPTNPFHTIEFTADELRTVLGRSGLVVDEVLGVHHRGPLAVAERVTGRTLTELQLATNPDDWPAWLRLLVRTTRTGWFRVTPRDVDASLDLLAVCRNPA